MSRLISRPASFEISPLAHLYGPTGDAGRLFSGVLQIAELPAAQRALVLDAYRAGISGASPSGQSLPGSISWRCFSCRNARCAAPPRSNLGRARS